jgi:phosphoglycerate dehydrogenase-like enzyme
MTFNVLFRGQVFGAEVADLARRKSLNFSHVPDDAALFAQLPDADVLWITPSCYQAHVAKALCEKPHKLKWLALTSSGYDVFTRFGAPSSVQLTYAAGVHAPTVAEHGIGQILCLLRRFPATLEAQKQGRWNSAALIPSLRALEDLKVCVIGLGPIGQQLVRKLNVLAREVTAVTLSGQPHADVAVSKFEDLDHVLPTVDAVFIATPLTDKTKNMFDGRRLSLLRPGSYLVNLARGPIVDAGAVVAALHSGALAGAALDVTDPEPLPDDHALWSAPNILITPHVAAFGSIATGARLSDHLDRNLQHLASHEPLEGQIKSL